MTDIDLQSLPTNSAGKYLKGEMTETVTTILTSFTTTSDSCGMSSHRNTNTLDIRTSMLTNTAMTKEAMS